MTPLYQFLTILTLVTLLGCGVVSGVFFAFSTFVMRALGRLPPHQGIAAMQAINQVVRERSWFLFVFVATALLCVGTFIGSFLQRRDLSAVFLLLGSVLYLVGGFLVTIVCNVPKNNKLAAASAGDPADAEIWADYLSSWTRWNHVRTASTLLADVAFAVWLAY